MIIGLIGPISCLGGVFITAGALEEVSYRSAVGAMVVPIVLSLAGLFLGAYAFFMIALKPEALRGSGYAGAGLALNIVGGALNILMATQVIRLGKMTSNTSLYTLRALDSGDPEKIDAVFHESVKAQLTAERIAEFRTELRTLLGNPDEARGAESLGQLMGVRWPDAMRVIRDGKGDTEIPAVPLWFEDARAFVVLSVHEDIASQLISTGVSLDTLVTDVWVIGEDGQEFRLLGP